MHLEKKTIDSIKNVASILSKGGIGIIPTDTLYGLSGCVPASEQRINTIKGRTNKKGLIQLIAQPTDIFLYTEQRVPNQLLELWPAPLTLIVQKNNTNKTIAFRCPADQWLRQLIQETGFPLYSTSVNQSGQQALSDINDIIANFADQVDVIVDAGILTACASTIVDISNDKTEVLRQGPVFVEVGDHA